MDRLCELPISVQDYLSGFVTRWRRLIALRAVGTALAVFMVWALCACAADRVIHLPGSVRLVLLVAGGVAALVGGIVRLLPLGAPIDWVKIANLIERDDRRFEQRLTTVTSRVLGSPEHRGSDEILSHLLREVELRVAEPPQNRLLDLRSVAGSWGALAIATGLILLLARIGGLGGPRLLARFISPFSNVPPVTTTELRVVPGDVDVPQSEPLHLEVDARRLGMSPVWVFLSDDGGTWSRYTMDDAGAGHFSFTINAVGRDLRYYVSGGDAASRQYAVRVKRPPAVAEFRFRYTYPAYTGKAPFSVSNSDGSIEGPANSDVVMTLVATEPLQSALLTVGDQKVLMERTSDDHVRQATLRIQRDINYDIDLISTREVRGGGPGKMAIRATADRPPLVRLLQAGQTLRLNPRDVLPLTYQAMDDYGLVTAWIVAQVNAAAPVRVPLQLSGDRHRQEETFNFDLGSLQFNVGDVLALTVGVRDTAGHEAQSDELRVLISPRSIDLDARERIDDLNSAARFASVLAGELDAAGNAIDETEAQKDHQSAGYLSASARASRHLTSASESATLVHQSLLRTAAHSNSPELSIALSAWVDVVQQETETADDLFRRGDLPDGMGLGARDRIHHAIDQSRELYVQVHTAAQGERAGAVLADREDLKASQGIAAVADTKAAERLTQTLARAEEEISAGAAEVGVNASSPDADNQLRARVEAARQAINSRQPIDFAALVRDWAQEMQRGPHQSIGLDARLAAAADAEAVRKDADLAYARDLQLVARAMTAIEVVLSQAAAGKPLPQVQFNPFVSAVAALQHEHVLYRQLGSGHVTDELRGARTASARAREDLSRWAGETGQPKGAVATSRPGDVESLALRAGSDASHREYKRVAEEDRALAQKLNDAARKPGGRSIDGDASPAAAQLIEERLRRIAQISQAVAGHMTAAETVDRLGQTQEKLAQEARSSRKASGDLAVRQRSVAEQIADIERQQAGAAFPTTGPANDSEDPNWRGRATAAILDAQEKLASMPQGLALAQEAGVARRKAAERAEAARREAFNAPPDRMAMLSRAADQAEKDAQEAADHLDKAIAAVAPMGADLANRLAPFAPEASTANKVVGGPLVDALGEFQSACRGKDGDAVVRAAADARKSIDIAQKELGSAQESFTDRDPLVAAKWFARAAADSLAHHPNDLHAAMEHQANVSLALSRAWDRSIHRASELRLSVLPSLQTVYGPTAPVSSEAAGGTALSPNLASRDWSHLHSVAGEGDDMSAALRDPDPPGYEEPLRLYFEAIGKAQEKAK